MSKTLKQIGHIAAMIKHKKLSDFFKAYTETVREYDRTRQSQGSSVKDDRQITFLLLLNPECWPYRLCNNKVNLVKQNGVQYCSDECKREIWSWFSMISSLCTSKFPFVLLIVLGIKFNLKCKKKKKKKP